MQLRVPTISFVPDFAFESICESFSSAEMILFGFAGHEVEKSEPLSPLHRIDTGAFICCPSLKSICISASLKVIGTPCFKEGQSLSRMTFEDISKLQQIAAHAFWGCSSLPSICIPMSV
jgi:hypothetical protein